jgi:hypothetical protein
MSEFIIPAFAEYLRGQLSNGQIPAKPLHFVSLIAELFPKNTLPTKDGVFIGFGTPDAPNIPSMVYYIKRHDCMCGKNEFFYGRCEINHDGEGAGFHQDTKTIDVIRRWLREIANHKMIKIEKSSDMIMLRLNYDVMVPAMLFFDIPTHSSPENGYVQKIIPFRQDVTLFFSDEKLAMLSNL